MQYVAKQPLLIIVCVLPVGAGHPQNCFRAATQCHTNKSKAPSVFCLAGLSGCEWAPPDRCCQQTAAKPVEQQLGRPRCSVLRDPLNNP